ncbi:phosphoribosylamine--glycine ligase [Sulfobacillus harzensis]|uniref:phosphoribosylamine--glycine ligase n=1 Tax=Sulfobacillus harzensis TaxID=2729629 RepID=A0A7Y0L533_9FIRM|nr:phosphoribosylamine--glycine ligase [Sulfobacillus harzensis]NMP22605.1 phosphoribosylamine--glycine ligase [Sulfobacillus harzensis]
MEREALVVGGGAREHALVWGLKKSGCDVYSTPGNAGICQDATCFPSQGPDDVIAYFGTRRPLTVIGPEAPLAAGWSDALRAAGFPVVGPSAKAARLESSKRLAKEVMRQYDIPTAGARAAHHPEELWTMIAESRHWPMVLKQSGLAQGKGVVVAPDPEHAREVLNVWSSQDIWRDGVLFEEFLSGWELSVQVVTNGRQYVWLPTARDYKRLTPEAQSPNTGGMGAVAPIPLDAALTGEINRMILDPIMTYLSEGDLLYRGVLYAGLMITAEGPKVLEFNVRLGDPETQVVVPLVDVDWWDFWYRVSQGDVPALPEPRQAAVAVVMAARGYPVHPQRGMRIVLGPEAEDTQVFHAGTGRDGDGFVSQGGRVLTVSGWAKTLPEARAKAYQRVSQIDFPDSYIRPDIGEL